MRRIWLYSIIGSADSNSSTSSRRKHCPAPLISSPRPKEFLDSLKKKHRDITSLKKFKKCVADRYRQFSGYEQHDAQEFLSYLISALHMEMKLKKEKSVHLLQPYGLR